VRRLPIAVAIAALVLLGALAKATGTTATSDGTAHAASAPVTATTVVCPAVNGTPSGTTSLAAVADVSGALRPASKSAGAVTATVLAGPKSKRVTLHPAPASVLRSVAKTNRTIAITATGSVAASLAADQLSQTATGRFRALSTVRCAAPKTDWWFSGTDGRVGFTDVLILANPTRGPAETTVSLWSDKGPLQNPRLQSVRVAGHSVVRIPISAAAPDDASVGVHVHATSGAVTAAVLDHRSSGLKSEGGDFIPETSPPATNAVVAGYPPGSGPRYVIITNPGDRDATVDLKLVTKSGSFTPTGINQFVVRAQHARVVELTKSLNGSSAAVGLSSDQPVFANGISVTLETGQRPDVMWLGATPALTGPAAIADGHEPDGGRTFLYLAAPQGTARVRVSAPSGRSATVVVPARHSVVADITKTIKAATGPWPFVVTPIGAAPVYGVRAMYFPGAHGALITGEPLIGLPKPIVLPPVREDPRVALR
jgi:hypothetical protein